MKRPLYVGEFEDGSGFAFNPEHPSGVKYLRPNTFNRLKQAIKEFGSPPILPSELRDIGEANNLVHHGLANYEDETNIFHTPQPKTKTLTVWLHISNACNLSCGYCYIPGLRKAATGDIGKNIMTPNLSKQALSELVSLCKEDGFDRLQIKFAGGEPTLNEPVVISVCEATEELRSASSVGIDLRMLTNGVFDTQHWIPIFIKYRIGVSISVDGAPSDHNKTRFTVSRLLVTSERTRIERNGTWETVHKTINCMLDNGLKPYLLCTVTPKNITSIHEFVKYCKEHTIGFRLSPVRDGNSFKSPSIIQSITDSLCALYEDIGKNYPIAMPIERFARFAEWNLGVKKNLACGTCRSTLSVDQVGRIASCQMRMDVPFGSIEETTVTEAFRKIQLAPENHVLVAPGRKTGDCVVCEWRYTCAGGCPEHTRSVFGTADHSSPWCHLYGVLMPTYIRAIAQQLKRTVEASTDYAQQGAPADRLQRASPASAVG